MRRQVWLRHWRALLVKVATWTWWFGVFTSRRGDAAALMSLSVGKELITVYQLTYHYFNRKKSSPS